MAQRIFEKIKKDEAIEVEVDRDFKKMKEDAAALEEEVQRDWEKIKNGIRKGRSR